MRTKEAFCLSNIYIVIYFLNMATGSVCIVTTFTLRIKSRRLSINVGLKEVDWVYFGFDPINVRSLIGSFEMIPRDISI